MAERRLVVFATDAVTRNNTQLTIGALHHGMQSRWRFGVPSTVSHDATRPIGWAWPFAIHLEPGLVRVVGIMELAESTEERETLLAAYATYLSDKNEQETNEHLPRLRELLEEHLDGTETVEHVTVAAMVGPNLARRVFPQVFEAEDADGLVPFSAVHSDHQAAIAPGVYRRGELALVAHPYFRRSFSRRNNLNHELLEALESAATSKDVTVRLRLDPDVVGLAASFLTPIEQQYWYGPKFSDDVTKIPIGVTRHEASERQRFYNAISRTEFWWQSRDGEHILEAEELRDQPTFVRPEVRYGCRYVHSMVDEATGIIHHLDGAIREYTEEGMANRLDQDIAAAGRHTMYTKLWRVDGRIALSSMKTLVHHHFRDNTLVAEYLENKDAIAVEDLASATLTAGSATSRLVPYSMRDGDGVQVVLAYRSVKPDVGAPTERSIVPFAYDDSSGSYPCVPTDVLELQKLLQRNGHTLSIPNEWRVVGYRDAYTNFPLIRHANRAALEATLASLRLLTGTWKRLKQDRCVAVNLAVHSNDRDTTVSIAGHVNDVDNWLCRSHPIPPDDVTAHGSWIETAAESMAEITVERDGRPHPALMNDLGLLLFEREPLQRSEYELVPSEGGLMVKLMLDTNDAGLMKSVESGALAVKLAYIINKSTCGRCGGEYRECPCIKLVDEGVTRRITSLAPIFVFWTDRPSESSSMTVVR